MMRTTAPLMVVVLALFMVLPANAQEHDNSAFIENYTGDFDGASKKLADLAEATPAKAAPKAGKDKPAKGSGRSKRALMKAIENLR